MEGNLEIIENNISVFGSYIIIRNRLSKNNHVILTSTNKEIKFRID